VNPPTSDRPGSAGWEPAFNSKNFRPVRPTSITIFQKHLAKKGVPERVS
jgi:hypothetical protein